MSKTADPEVRIVLPSWERRALRLSVQGVTPLLTDRIPDHVLEDIRRKQEGKTAIPRPKRDQRQVFEDALYVIDAEKQRYGFPCHGFRKSVARAAQRFNKGVTLVQMYGLIQVPDGLFEIQAPAPVLTEMAGRNMKRDLIPLIRPLFMPWKMDVEMTYSYPGITDEQVVNLVNLAGATVGIGAARVECGMTYGQFQVAEVRSA
jgi:hypothetical protein